MLRNKEAKKQVSVQTKCAGKAPNTVTATYFWSAMLVRGSAVFCAGFTLIDFCFFFVL